MPRSPAPAAADLSAVNRAFYDPLWSASRLTAPERFNTWPMVARLVARGGARLEVGPGLRPRLPLAGTHFADLSRVAVERLRAGGGTAVHADTRALPFPAGAFALVCALDIVEHVADDAHVFAELTRVLAPGGLLLLSIPLHQARWTEFDAVVGHYRRYDPPVLLERLAAHGLTLESSAAYGMQPRSSLLSNLGAWWLRHHRAQALRWYNRCLPLAIHFEQPLSFADGLIDTARVDEILLVCRRA
jgi:SAM-dependent methyltransferase